MKAWHFVDDILWDGKPVPADGEKLVHDGLIDLCNRGLHASINILDALKYAPGSTICRVECGGEVLHGDDKLVCTERTILWRVDGWELLREYARLCALDVIHLWDAPDVVVRYLKTGDAKLRSAACAAARSTAPRAAVRAAVCAAAWAAEWSAACAAVCAVRDALRAAARDAVRAALRKKQQYRLLKMVHAEHRRVA